MIKCLRKLIASCICAAFSLNMMVPPSYAQAVTRLNLPVPGMMIAPTPAFEPTLVRGMMIYPDNPLKFDFIIDRGEENLSEEEFKTVSTKLVKYFMASLTVPEKDMWVNLSPYEKNRIVPVNFGQTEMGRDLLAEDYLLKQLTASLMYPDSAIGKEFWKKVYAKAQERFGTTDIPMNTFNKVWIIPDKVTVYEHAKGAFIVKSRLKVMLEEDYVALSQNSLEGHAAVKPKSQSDNSLMTGLQSQLVREILIPEIEREVNEGKTFVQLRQIYNSMILASWYKKTLKESLLGKVYVDQNKTEGVQTNDKDATQKIYDQYIEAFKKGAYDYIKEDYNPETQEVVTRKYISGGVELSDESMIVEKESKQATIDAIRQVSQPERGEVTTVVLQGGNVAQAASATLPLSARQQGEQWADAFVQSLDEIKDQTPEARAAAMAAGALPYVVTNGFSRIYLPAGHFDEWIQNNKPTVNGELLITGRMLDSFYAKLNAEWQRRELDKTVASLSSLARLSYETVVYGDKTPLYEEITKRQGRITAATYEGHPERETMEAIIELLPHVSHLKINSLHAETIRGQKEFFDQEALIPMAKKFMKAALNLRKNKTLWDTEIPSQEGYNGTLNVTYGDMVLWGMKYLFDPVMFDYKYRNQGEKVEVTNGDLLALMTFEKKIDGSPLSLMQYYFKRLVDDADIDRDSLEDLLIEAFNRPDRQWEKSGLRAPTRFALSDNFLVKFLLIFKEMIKRKKQPLPLIDSPLTVVLNDAQLEGVVDNVKSFGDYAYLRAEKKSIKEKRLLDDTEKPEVENRENLIRIFSGLGYERFVGALKKQRLDRSQDTDADAAMVGQQEAALNLLEQYKSFFRPRMNFSLEDAPTDVVSLTFEEARRLIRADYMKSALGSLIIVSGRSKFNVMTFLDSSPEIEVVSADRALLGTQAVKQKWQDLRERAWGRKWAREFITHIRSLEERDRATFEKEAFNITQRGFSALFAEGKSSAEWPSGHLNEWVKDRAFTKLLVFPKSRIGLKQFYSDLNEYWEKQELDKTVAPLISIMGQAYDGINYTDRSPTIGEVLQKQKILDEFVSLKPGDRVIERLAKILVLVSHIKNNPFHAELERGETVFLDHKAFFPLAKAFIQTALELKGTQEWKDFVPAQEGYEGTFKVTYGDVVLWGMKYIFDSALFDFNYEAEKLKVSKDAKLNIEMMTELARQNKWDLSDPNTGNLIRTYFMEILINDPQIDRVKLEELLIEAFRISETEWKGKGLRQPLQFALNNVLGSLTVAFSGILDKRNNPLPFSSSLLSPIVTNEKMIESVPSYAELNIYRERIDERVQRFDPTKDREEDNRGKLIEIFEGLGFSNVAKALREQSGQTSDTSMLALPELKKQLNDTDVLRRSQAIQELLSMQDVTGNKGSREASIILFDHLTKEEDINLAWEIVMSLLTPLLDRGSIEDANILSFARKLFGTQQIKNVQRIFKEEVKPYNDPEAKLFLLKSVLAVMMEDKDGDLAITAEGETIELKKSLEKYLRQASVDTEKDPDVAITAKKGGIDFNPVNLKMNVNKEGEGVQMAPVSDEAIQNMNINGFVPVIINVTPATNLPMLLGIATEEKKGSLASAS
jgi:hypothetical protein